MMKFHCRATEFLRSVYLIYLNQYLPAIQTLRRPKNNLSCPPFFFFATSIQFVACVLRENLSNRSSRVQIPRDICTRLGCYLYANNNNNNNNLILLLHPFHKMTMGALQ